MKKWLENAVFYQIYPQSFRDSNGDGIGDIRGIIEKLDYIKSIGCDAIWVNPLFVSPFSDAGYDVADYCKVAPRYGTNEDLADLFAEVHKRGMHILLDLVPGHTSVEHPWFSESMKAEKNEFSDRYIWTNSVWEKPSNNCLCGFAPRNGNCALNFFSCQPALNYGYYQPERPWQEPTDGEGPKKTLAEIEKIMAFWLKMGCDGFRVDMAGSLVKNDPEGRGNIALWQEVRRYLDAEFPDAVLVSEWGEPDRSIAGGFDMDFLLHFGPSHYNDLFRCDEPFFSARGKGDISEFAAYYKEIYKKSEGKGFISVPSGNHDMVRLSHFIGEDNMKIAFAFLLSLPGVPFIYYGDEIAMRYVEGLASVEGGYNRTGSRSPMQWDDSENVGFGSSAAERLYIRQDASADRPTVKAQQGDKDSLLHTVMHLIALRKATPALSATGKMEFLYAEKDAYPLAYIRSDGKENILVVINPAAREASFPFAGTPREVIYKDGNIRVEQGRLIAEPCSAVFVKID